MRIFTAVFSSFIVLLITFVSPCAVNGDVYVRGHYRNGKWVQPHYRSDPDGDFSNNWSTKGNQNPYTGKWGTKSYPSTSSGGSLPFGSAGSAYSSERSPHEAAAIQSMSGGYRLTKRPPPFGILYAKQRHEEFQARRRLEVDIREKDWTKEERAKCDLEVAYKFESLGRLELYEKWLRQVLDCYPETEAAMEASSLLRTSALASR